MGRIAGVELINGSQWLPFRVLTGRGADFILIDDPLKPEEAPDQVVGSGAIGEPVEALATEMLALLHD